MTIEITDETARFDVALIHRFLSEESHWARGIPRAVVEKSIAHSLCFGALADGAQVGFARVVTDRSTFAFLCDVFVLSAWRGKGLARRLIDAVVAHPDLQGLRRFALTSRDAAALYNGYGFTALASPQVWLERHNPAVYTEARST
jgi:GNAT superfamily N-acetyltransferase